MKKLKFALMTLLVLAITLVPAISAKAGSKDCWGYQAYYRNLKSIKLPNTLKKIGDRAFLEIGGLKTITFPSSLNEIGVAAFKACGFTKLVIPGNVKRIGDSAFSSLRSVQRIELKEGVEEIGKLAFHYTTMPTINIPSSVRKIEDSAFNSSSLIYVKIPSTVKELGEGVFYQSYSLQTAEIDFNGPLTGTLSWCENLHTVKFGPHVTELGGNMFYRCYSLQDVYIPSSVNKIDISGATNDFRVYCNKGTEAYKFCGSSSHAEFINIDQKANLNKWNTLWRNKSHFYTVTTKNGKEVSTRLFNLNDKYTDLPAVVKKANYIFNGWYTAKKGGKKFTSKTKITKNLTIYPQFTKITLKPTKFTSKKRTKNRVTLKWNKVKGAEGYKVKYRYKKGSWKVARTKKTTYTFKNLYYNMGYTFKVQPYKTDSCGRTVEGKWSKEVSLKIPPFK